MKINHRKLLKAFLRQVRLFEFCFAERRTGLHEKAHLYFSDGELKRKDNTLYFESEEGKRYIPVENTSEIHVFGETDLNKRFLEFITRTEIIHFTIIMGITLEHFIRVSILIQAL